MAEVGDNKRKRGIDLDWEKLLDSSAGDEESLPVLVIRKGLGKPNPPVEVMVEESDKDVRYLSDKELIDNIHKFKTTLIPLYSSKLADGGEKLRARLKANQDELDRRKSLKGSDKGNVIPLDDFPTHDANDDSPNGAPHLESASEFARHLCGKLDGNQKATKCFSGELSTLNFRQRRNDGLPTERAGIIGLSSKQTPFKSPFHLLKNNNGSFQENKEVRSSHLSTSRTDLFDKELLDQFSKRECTPQSGSRRRSIAKDKSVVLVDEEEELEFDLNSPACPQSIKDSTIYYPSSDDPEAIEIHFSELENLAPETYLSSTIMNFYIGYLQKKASSEARNLCDYHFFNTYFYEKLKRDVLSKGDREAAFEKFRRWWKGVNLFEKAYIFLPIYEKEHWSLVIICIPSKEAESGPLILHMDSLEFHTSESIFKDVKSFLIEEWKFLKQEELLPGLPIADHIWEKLSRRINEKVPQQENVYDCGLFVLYFLELFIEAAPARLKKGDLEMFGRQWFRPEEASSLRVKIRKLLREEFNMQTKEHVN